MTLDVQPPILTRYGYTWVQHPDGLYYGPSYPGEDTTLAWMEGEGTLGHRSVARGDERYFLRHPEQEAPRSDRFGWDEGDIGYHPVNPEADEADEADDEPDQRGG
jgi:hypothetical protein